MWTIGILARVATTDVNVVRIGTCHFRSMMPIKIVAVTMRLNLDIVAANVLVRLRPIVAALRRLGRRAQARHVVRLGA